MGSLSSTTILRALGCSLEAPVAILNRAANAHEPRPRCKARLASKPVRSRVIAERVEHFEFFGKRLVKQRRSLHDHDSARPTTCAAARKRNRRVLLVADGDSPASI